MEQGSLTTMVLKQTCSSSVTPLMTPRAPLSSLHKKNVIQPLRSKKTVGLNHCHNQRVGEPPIASAGTGVCAAAVAGGEGMASRKRQTDNDDFAKVDDNDSVDEHEMKATSAT